MKRGITVTILMLLAVGAGCGRAKQVKVTYKSDPPGGTLYRQDGEFLGQCPKVLWYDVNQEHYESGYLDAKGLITRWPSGPEKRSGDLIRITVNGTNRQVVFTQPKITAKATDTSSE